MKLKILKAYFKENFDPCAPVEFGSKFFESLFDSLMYGIGFVCSTLKLILYPVWLPLTIAFYIFKDWLNHISGKDLQMPENDFAARASWKVIRTRYELTGLKFYRRYLDLCTDKIAKDEGKSFEKVEGEWEESWRKGF